MIDSFQTLMSLDVVSILLSPFFWSNIFKDCSGANVIENAVR